MSYCPQCQPKKLWSTSEDTREEKDHAFTYNELCWLILQRASPLNVSILDIFRGDPQTLRQYINQSTFPNLIVLSSELRLLHAAEVIDSTACLPMFRHVLAKCFWNPVTMRSLRSSTVTTLSIVFHASDPSFISSIQDISHLPALRHLCIRNFNCSYRGDYEEPLWLPLLRVLGKDLRTLYLPLDPSGLPLDIPPELWSICPKIEYLHLSGHRMTIPPPSDHPIRLLGISPVGASWRYNPENHAPGWPGLRVIQMDSKWARHFQIPQFESLSLRLRLEDPMGESYADFISRVELGAVDQV
ncbi:hypothetical protein CPB86DRAFT_810185 [Serendipita vermifera]|nr:hypothetical protein CPB86DRAFT_810185 [Serendipita vermifera]